MSDINESIEIEIEASARNASGQLDGIDKALENIQGSLKGITDILSGLDGKIAPISRAMNRLAGDIERINPAVFKTVSKDIEDMGTSMSKTQGKITSAEKAIVDAANDMKRAFNIDPSNMSELEQKIRNLYTATDALQKEFSKTGDNTQETVNGVNSAASALNDYVKNVAQVKVGLNESQKELKDWINSIKESGEQFNISFMKMADPSNYKEIAENLRSITSLTKGSWDTTKLNQMFTDFVAEHESLAKEIGISAKDNASDLKALSDAIAQVNEVARTGTVSLGEFMRLTSQSNFSSENIAKGASSFQEIQGTVTGLVGEFEKVSYEVNDLGNQAQDVATKVKAAMSSARDSIASDFNISDVSGLEELISKLAEARAVMDRNDGMESAVQGYQDAMSALEQFIQANQNANASMLEISQKVVSVGGSFKGLAEDISTAGTQMENISEETKQLPALFETMKESIPEFGDIGFKGIADEASNAAQEISTALSTIDFSKAEMQVKVFSGDVVEIVKNELAPLKDIELFDFDVIDVTELSKVGGELYELYSRLKELQTVMSQMKSGGRIFEDSEFFQVSDEIADVQARIKELQDAYTQAQEVISSGARTDTWTDVLADIGRMNSDYEQLSHTMGEANAEMQILIDTRNRLKQAFSDTESGKMLWDNESMKQATTMLSEVEDKINKVKASMKDPNKLEIDVQEPTSEIEQLYARLKELQSLMSDMQNLRINFDNSQFRQTAQEIAQVQARIKEIQGTSKDGGGSAPKTNTTEWMAQIIAIQHELEKASALFSKWGDMAKNAFIKALTPLKLFKHEFMEIKNLVTRVGSGFAMISKPITKIFKNFQKSAQESFAKIQKAWGKVMRTFTFMLIRKAITAVITNISDATKSLASFSKDIGTSFNSSMSLLTSDFRYLGASLVAAFEPILNYVTPILDRLVDSLVAVINKVNMFLAVLTNSKSYTIAKKKIIDYTGATKDANKAVKQLTMGIDELNILNDSSSSSSNSDEDYFDWEELTTPQLDLPDWIKQIKDLIDAFVNAFKKAWDNVGDFLLDAFKHLIDSVKGLISDIIRDLTRLFNSEEFQKFLETIMRIIAKIAELIATIIDRIREAWNYNDLGYRILQDILAILQTIATHIENMLDNAIAWAKELNFVPLFEAVEKALRQVNYAVDQIGYVVEDLFDLFLKLGKYLIEDWAPRLIGVFGNVVEGIGNIAGQIHKAWQEIDFGTKVADAINGIVDEIIKHLESLSEYFIEWGKSLDFTPIMNAFVQLLESLKPVAGFIGGVFEDIVEDYILPTVQHLLEKVIPDIMKALSHFADAVDWDKLRKNLDTLIKAFETLTANIGEGVALAIDEIGQAVAQFVNSKDFQDFCDNLAKFMERITPELVSKVLVGIAKAILRIVEALVEFVNSETFQKFLDKLLTFLENTSSDKIADILLNIAKAIAFFKFASFVSKGFANFMTFLSLIGKLKEAKALKTLAEQAKKIGENASGAGKAAEEAGKLGKKAAETAGGGAGSLATKIGGVTAMVGGTTLAVGSFAEMWQNGWSVIGEILKDLGIAIAAVGAVVLGLVTGPVAAVVAGVVAAVSTIAILLHDHWDEVSGWFKEKWADFKEWAGEFWDGLVEGIANIWHGFIEKVGAIWETIKEWFGGIWSSFKEWVGETWSGIVDGVVGAWRGFTEKIGEVWQSIHDWFSTAWESFKTWAGEIWTGIVDGIVGAWNGFVEKIQGVWETIHQWFDETWTAFTEWVGGVWSNIVDTIVGAWNDFVSSVQEIWDGFKVWIDEKWTAFKEGAAELWGTVRDTIVDAWKAMHDKAKEYWDKIKEHLDDAWTWMRDTAKETFEKIRDKVSDAWSTIKNKTVETWNNVKSKLNETWTWAKENAKTTFEKIRATVVEKWNKIHEKSVEIWDNVKTFLGGLWNDLKNDSENIFSDMHTFLEGVWNDIEGKWQTAWDATKNTVKDLWNKIDTNAHGVFDACKSFLETVWDGIKNTWASAWEGIHETVSEKWEMFKSTAKVKFGELKDTIDQKWDEIKITAGSAWDKIKSTVKNKWNELKPDAKEIFGDLAKTVSDAWADIKKAVGDTWDGIGKFLGELQKNVTDFVGKVSDAISKMDTLKKKQDDMTASTKAGKPFWQVDGFADGGFPNKGSIFIAGEAGAELVGNINGKTAVANAEQISEAIEEAVGSAMEKIVSMMEKSLDRMAENINDSMETFEKSNRQVIVELKTISANQTAIWKDASDFIRDVYSLITKVMDAVAYEITSSNKELKDSYQTDDSAVTSALTRITGEYEMSNQDISASIDRLATYTKECMIKVIEVLQTTSVRQIEAMSSMASFIKDAVNTIRTSLEASNRSSTPVSDFSGIENGLDTLNASMGSGFEMLYDISKDIFKGIESARLSITNTIANGLGVPAYANGGFPEDGWFRASHGEIMGRFDNGQSVVANNDQVTDGIAQAVSSALVPILQDIANSNATIANKDMSLSIDSREIARANNSGQSKLGRSLVSFS